jgi:hypothetical protein
MNLTSVLGVGAAYANCIREDFKLTLQTIKKNYSVSAVLGCCEVASRNMAGTLMQHECQKETVGKLRRSDTEELSYCL